MISPQTNTSDLQNNRYFFFCLAILCFSSAFIVPGLTPYMRWASVSYFTFVMGLYFRKERKKHVPMMLTAITMDLSLVLLLEFQRHAIKTATAFTLSVTQQLHIGFSTLAVVCYFPLLYLGYLRLRNKGNAKTYLMHYRVGIIGALFRTLGFFFMFSLLK